MGLIMNFKLKNYFLHNVLTPQMYLDIYLNNNHPEHQNLKEDLDILEEDVLNGYELGADDYVTKPFSMKILLKKVYVILSRKSQEANIYDDGFLKVDFELGIVQQGVNECLLSPTEYRILKKLIENKGKLLTYSVLLDSLWDEGVQITDKHTLAVNINRLRKKIETEEHSYISNVYGMGYIWK